MAETSNLSFDILIYMHAYASPTSLTKPHDIQYKHCSSIARVGCGLVLVVPIVTGTLTTRFNNQQHVSVGVYIQKHMCMTTYLWSM